MSPRTSSEWEAMWAPFVRHEDDHQAAPFGYGALLSGRESGEEVAEPLTSSEWETLWAPFLRRVAGSEGEGRAAPSGDDISFEVEELSDSSDDVPDGGFIMSADGGLGDGGGLVWEGAGAIADRPEVGIEGNAAPAAGNIDGRAGADHHGEVGGLGGGGDASDSGGDASSTGSNSPAAGVDAVTPAVKRPRLAP